MYVWQSTVLAILHVALALSVTGHALLTKPDVRAAIGWIGLAWLSPFIGPALYLIFGINRVVRRALRLRPRGRRPDRKPPPRFTAEGEPEPPLDQLRRLGRAVSGIGLSEGNRFDLLDNGDGAYPVMLEAIAGAERSIALASYIFRDDVAGRPFIEALTAAHARGVAVRVLVDGIGGGWLYSGVAKALRPRGVPVGKFLHSLLPWRMSTVNLRNHRKLLVVDGRIGFTGGLNIGGENLLASRPRHPVRDLHARIEGPVVAHMLQVFKEDWTFTTGEVLDGPEWEPAAEPVDGASVVARGLPSGPDEDFEAIATVIAGALAVAQHSIRIVTPYFLPDAPLLEALRIACLRGLAVDLILPERSNHRFVDWASHAQMKPLLQAGCRIFLTPAPFDHAKLMAVDEHWVLIGSANWDVRSLRLNFEYTVECYCRVLAARLREEIESRMDSARPLTVAEMSAMPRWKQIRDAAVRLGLPYL